jgi:site-specific DNA-methyltransferase (adenine-specific)
MDDIIIINGDCIEELEKLQDESIDCVITDPPYFIKNFEDDWNENDIKNTSNHIKHLPKGMKFDKIQVKKLYDFYLKVSIILFRKMKPGAFFLSFSYPRLYHSIAMSCEIAGFEIRDMINWTYTKTLPKGMSITKSIERLNICDEEKVKLINEYKNFKTPQLKSCFEPICVAMKPIKETFLKNELNFKTGLLDFSNKVGIDNDKIPANVMTCEQYNEIYDKNFLIQKNKDDREEYNNHPTIKPLKLIEHLVNIFSKDKSLVLDPFLGSGTTALACKNTNRKCIGIEKNINYYDICIKRIS